MFFFNLLPILTLVPITVIAQGVDCPFVYPPEINNTNSVNGLVFTVFSDLPAINHRALQLRPNISEPGSFIAAIDNTSSVLLSNIIDGGLYSQGTDFFFGGVSNLGPTGFLTVVSEFNETTVWSLGFATRAAPSVEENFIILLAGTDGTYFLLSTLSLLPGTTSEVIICEAVDDLDNGAWYQIFFTSTMTTSGNVPSFQGCTNGDLRVTLAPTIPGDGTCIIGGYTAANISSD